MGQRAVARGVERQAGRVCPRVERGGGHQARARPGTRRRLAPGQRSDRRPARYGRRPARPSNMTDVVPAVETTSRRASSFPLRGLLFLGLAVLVVVVDQLTKRLAE